MMKFNLIYIAKYILKQRYLFFFIVSALFFMSTISCQGCIRTILGQNEVSSSVTNIYVVEDIFKPNARMSNIQLAVDINRALNFNTNALYEHEGNSGELLGKVVMSFPNGVTPSALFWVFLRNNSVGTNFIIGNQIGAESTVNITVTNLPRGLRLRINVDVDLNSDEIKTISLTPLGNAVAHTRSTDDIDNLRVVFSESLFATKNNVNVPNQFTNDAVAFFDIVFGSQAVLPRWEARHEHQVFAYNNKLWLLGGNVTYSDRTGRTNDIWVSSDKGTNWTGIVTNADWERRSTHEAFVYNDSLYVLGGRGHSSTEVWFSNIWSGGNNGLNWTRVSSDAAWSGRFDHQVLADTTTILVLGGLSLNSALSGRRINDVWQSTDGGDNWTVVTGTASWSARYRHQAVKSGNKVWVLGGNALTGAVSSMTNDVWRSQNNGQTWLSMTASATWSPRENHQSFFGDNKLWVIGGSLRNDVWYSSDDGQSWSSATLNAEWEPRESHQSFFYDERLWVVGGRGTSGNIYNDIWFSTNGGTNWVSITREEGEFSYE